MSGLIVNFVKLDIAVGSPQESLSLLFTYPSQVINHDAIPILRDVSVTAAKVEPGRTIGQRESVNVSLDDCLHRFDTEPLEAGTLFTKLRARYPTLQGQTLTIYRGESGQELAEMQTTKYIISSLDIGPSSAAITAQDPLYLLKGSSAQAPTPNSGQIAVGIDNNDLAFTLTPAGIGALEYGASGFLCLGGVEVVSFTRSGSPSDDIIITARALLGTTAIAHDSGTRVQSVLSFANAPPSEVVSTLLGYTDLDPVYWDDTQWTDADADTGVTFTVDITEPTSVEVLLNEVIEQTPLVVYYNPVTALIDVLALQPVVSSVDVDPDNIIQKSFAINEQPEMRISESLIFYSRRDITKRIDEENNYRRGIVQFADNAADFPQQSIKKIRSRWVTSQANAQRLSDLLIARYKTPPRKFEFSLFHGEDTPGLGDGVNVSHWQIVDGDGTEIAIPSQIVSAAKRHDRTDYVAEEMGFEAPISEEEGTVLLDDHTVWSLNATIAEAGFFMGSGGQASHLGTSFPDPAFSVDEWFTTGNVPGVGSSYWVKASNSGAALESFSDALDTYLSLETSRYWYLVSSAGQLTAPLTISISTTASDVGIVDTATITLVAWQDPAF